MLLRLRSISSSSANAGENPAEFEPLFELARELGYRTRFLDRERLVLELTRQAGDAGGPADRSRFEDLGCVVSVLDASDAPELTSRTAERGDTVVHIGSTAFGGGSIGLIAGPCAVEDPADLLEIARAVRAAGATVLRGGAFKPRTSPHSFQGGGVDALAALADAREFTGLSIVTEVLDPRDVERVASVADALQIGSRSMSNAALLAEVGATQKPILLKRGLAATAREFLLAAEYVLAAGNPNVILCERGIRGFDNVTRNVLDLGTVAHLKTATHLPVVVDPSHAAGRPDLIAPLAKAGIAVGADGLIIEVHPRPASVHSDGAQAIAPSVFAEIVKSVSALARLEGKIVAAPRASEPSGTTKPREAEETAP